MHIKVFACLFMLILSCKHVNAQWWFGNDFGLASYDVKDEWLGPVRYEKTVWNSFNTAFYYVGESAFFTVRYGQRNTELESGNNTERYEFDRMYLQNYALDVEYLRKLAQLPFQIDGFIGVGNNAHFTYMDQSFRQAGTSVGGGQESHEMSIANISILGLLQRPWKKHIFQYKLGIAALGYGTRPENFGNEFNFKFFGFGEYVQFQNSVTGFIRLSEFFVIKPEYRLRYTRYSDPLPLQFLQQSFYVGLYVKI